MAEHPTCNMAQMAPAAVYSLHILISQGWRIPHTSQVHKEVYSQERENWERRWDIGFVVTK
jgi:hypothetical protein